MIERAPVDIECSARQEMMTAWHRRRGHYERCDEHASRYFGRSLESLCEDFVAQAALFTCSANVLVDETTTDGCDASGYLTCWSSTSSVPMEMGGNSQL